MFLNINRTRNIEKLNIYQVQQIILQIEVLILIKDIPKVMEEV